DCRVFNDLDKKLQIIVKSDSIDGGSSELPKVLPVPALPHASPSANSGKIFELESLIFSTVWGVCLD
ncbi:hypothetical protein PanWU01x14_362390, partial [Parasponia andersonii]